MDKKQNESYTALGDIILPDKLTVLSELNADTVIRIFSQDTQEIIYKTDTGGKIEGIVTYGAFIRNYGNRKNWVNINFNYTTIENINKDSIKDIFEKNEKILRVPVLDRMGKLCFEIRRYSEVNGREDKRKQLILFAKLRNSNIPCFFVRRPDILQGYDYSSDEQYRMENRLSFVKMRTDVNYYEKELRKVIGAAYSRSYVEKLNQIPPVIREGKRYRHADRKSEFVNVVGGKRITIDVPEKYDRCIHVYGRCGAFGYAVEDVQTMPSQLQRLCNKDGLNIRVENHGIWGSEEFLNNLSMDIKEGMIQENDIVLIYAMIDAWWHRDELENISVDCYDTTEEFHGFLKEGATFYDIPGHMTAVGYAFIAELIYRRMKNTNVFSHTIDKKIVSSTQDRFIRTDMAEGIKKYFKELDVLLPIKNLFRSRTGAIVMNCNPFTLGHRYLIENALNIVDYLVIFVVEENKSFFSFEDRIEMVKRGVKDISNVYVVPSGNYIISTLTFPGYFLKEEHPDLKIDVTEDVKIFGEYIAPALHITDRFVGTEPVDKVTAQYNLSLKRYLKDYGINLYEVPRKKTGDKYISASTVRKLLVEKDYEKLRQYVPDTTLEYLIKRKSKA